MIGRAVLPVALLLLLACSPSHSSPLHEAAVNQDIVLLKQLLDSGKYDVNERDASGRTPLVAALTTCSNYTTDRFPRMVPNGELHFCATGTAHGTSAILICGGADVNVDVFPKERPGYKLVHLAACSGANDIYELLTGGADPNARYRLPDGRTVTPLTYAAICAGAGKNSTEYGHQAVSIPTLLREGADPLPFGYGTPPSALMNPKPHPLSHCNKPGACSAAEVDRIWNAAWTSGKPIPGDLVYGLWRQLWDAQEAKHSNPKWQQLQMQVPGLAALGLPQCQTSDCQDRFKVARHVYMCNSTDLAIKNELWWRKQARKEAKAKPAGKPPNQQQQQQQQPVKQSGRRLRAAAK
ncbi:hypothetical protein OEZ86_008205 [Tetradesmus obliquus]|nr:hypothetical protein OEZ86_008205 [Tetradesmus obliquus]